MQARTQFPPEPRSAAQARHWVRDRLTEMGRADLVPAAEAGVSELVTNGILHAQTSIGLQLTRSNERVVIEVYDGSPTVHAASEGGGEAVDSTIGRGLRLVRAHAREWGVATTRHGKAIWFQPAPPTTYRPGAGNGAPGTGADEPSGAGDSPTFHPAGDLDATLDALAEAFPGIAAVQHEATGGATERDEERVPVRLLGVPPFVVHHYRKRWLELVREMQLVALADPSPQQETAQRLCAATQAVQASLYVLDPSTMRFAPAAADDGSRVDAEIGVRRGMRSAFVEIRDLTREMERSWAGTQLLFVHPGRQAVQLREWWLGEVIGQIDGAEPTPWPGELVVRDEAVSSRDEA